MNKIKLFVVAAIIMFTAGNAIAQKSAYISVQDVVSLMPEVRKLDTVLQRYQADSLNPQFSSMVQEYNYKDSMLTSKDSLKIPAQVKKQYQQDMQGLAYQIQNWQQISQNAMQNKQNELLEPVYRKAYAAIQEVAKENGYGYVYTKEALLVAPPSDDLLPLVAKRLNIKLPTGNGAAMNGNGAARPSTPAPRKK